MTKEYVSAFINDIEQKKHNDKIRAELLSRLKSQEWRLNNLYSIKDKSGAKVRFKPNWAQQELFDGLHTRNLILKARQLGFTTAICIYMLDSVLFKSYQSAGIIAHCRDDAHAIFDGKIKFAWDNLPDRLKDEIGVSTDRSGELKFGNGSIIKVGTSLRSGTFNLLHITEFGKICARFPDKAQEIVTGSLNTVPVDGRIFIESTAEGRGGYYYDMCEEARKLQDIGRPLSQLDYKFFFFPWHRHPDYVLKEYLEIPKEQSDYFDKLKQTKDIDISTYQRTWYCKTRSTQKEEMFSEYPSTPDEAFLSANMGKVFGSYITKLRQQKRICPVEHDRELPVCVSFDLGRADATSIWFFQVYGTQYRFIDYYENTQRSMLFYMDLLKKYGVEKKYRYSNYYFPHDIRVTDYSQEDSRVEILRKYGISPIVIGRTLLEEQIDTARNALEKCLFDESNCAEGIKHLDNYHYEWDEKYACFSDRPCHDASSHGASAFMTACIGLKKYGDSYDEWSDDMILQRNAQARRRL